MEIKRVPNPPPQCADLPFTFQMPSGDGSVRFPTAHGYEHTSSSPRYRYRHCTSASTIISDSDFAPAPHNAMRNTDVSKIHATLFCKKHPSRTSKSLAAFLCSGGMHHSILYYGMMLIISMPSIARRINSSPSISFSDSSSCSTRGLVCGCLGVKMVQQSSYGRIEVS